MTISNACGVSTPVPSVTSPLRRRFGSTGGVAQFVFGCIWGCLWSCGPIPQVFPVVAALQGPLTGDPSRKSSSSTLLPAARNANRVNAGRDFDPVLCMIEARWFSTVRWLMPRRAAIFLLA